MSDNNALRHPALRYPPQGKHILNLVLLQDCRDQTPLDLRAFARIPQELQHSNNKASRCGPGSRCPRPSCSRSGRSSGNHRPGCTGPQPSSRKGWRTGGTQGHRPRGCVKNVNTAISGASPRHVHHRPPNPRAPLSAQHVELLGVVLDHLPSKPGARRRTDPNAPRNLQQRGLCPHSDSAMRASPCCMHTVCSKGHAKGHRNASCWLPGTDPAPRA